MPLMHWSKSYDYIHFQVRVPFPGLADGQHGTSNKHAEKLYVKCADVYCSLVVTVSIYTELKPINEITNGRCIKKYSMPNGFRKMSQSLLKGNVLLSNGCTSQKMLYNIITYYTSHTCLTLLYGVPVFHSDGCWYVSPFKSTIQLN